MAAIKPIDNDHPREWHLQRFVEFAHAKFAIGEPVSHMSLVVQMSRDADNTEKIWRAGLYAAAYSVISCEAIWNTWDYHGVRAMPEKLLPWLQDNWAGIHTRKERRCVRTPTKFAACLLSYHDWMTTDFPRLANMKTFSARDEYDMWWESANTIKYFGRYIAIRHLELLRHWGFMDAAIYDIRAGGEAHSLIRCLMLLRPDKIDELATAEPKFVEAIASEVRAELLQHDLDISWLNYSILLCEYRVAYEKAHEYPGRSHDEEIEYLHGRHGDHWRARGFASRLYEARAAIDPHECLGEKQGWSARRLEVAGWLRSHDTVWSDLAYDYAVSVAAGRPVVRAHV